MYNLKDKLQLKTNIKVKIVCVHVIPYIHCHKWISPYISMATITTFPGTSVMPIENGLNRGESFSFGAMPSLNIPDLAKAKQDLPFPDGQIGVFEPLLYASIIYVALTLLVYIK